MCITRYIGNLIDPPPRRLRPAYRNDPRISLRRTRHPRCRWPPYLFSATSGSCLRASLQTSGLVKGAAVLAAGLGLMLVVPGVAFLLIEKRPRPRIRRRTDQRDARRTVGAVVSVLGFGAGERERARNSRLVSVHPAEPKERYGTRSILDKPRCEGHGRVS